MSVLPAADPVPPRPEETPGARALAADLRRRRLFVLAAAVVLPPLLVVLYRFPPAQTSWYPGCLFHLLTGLHCPGCGGTRCAHALLHGDLRQALAYHVLLPFLLPFFLVWAARHVVAAARGRPAPPAVVSRRASLWVIAVVLLFWVLRNIPVWPLDLLAPHELTPPPPPAEAVSAAR